MVTMIDLTETSSDEEDARIQKPFSPSLTAVHVNGAAKKLLSRGATDGAGRGVVSSAAGSSKGVSVASSRADRNGGPGSSEKGQLKSWAAWRGGMTMGKNEMREVNTSADFSGWGDPLAPEPPSSNSPQDGKSPTENWMVGASVPTRFPIVSVSPVVAVKREVVSPVHVERMTGAGNKGSISSSPVPTATVAASSVPVDKFGVCRQFWRAGDDDAQPRGVRSMQGALDHARVHRKFLHSNATSQKWALGAVAELLDNAVDEVHNGATFVRVDKIVSPRDASPALLVQDDGGGMTPVTMRECMSFGYSRKNTNTTIGQYGNGFKTSTMRLGADVIVFSRHTQESIFTQSIGLLSYMFLRMTGCENVVVPMIDYEGSLEMLRNGVQPKKTIRSSLEDWTSKLISITQWSPYASEADLLKQFESLGSHGTKVIVYNLWFNDDGVLELDFDTDETDIQLREVAKQEKAKPVPQLAHNHIANRYHHSLRVYASILYLHMPEGFQFILRGKPVDHHLIASDLKFCESIIYKPKIGDGRKFTSTVTVGFTKEAPLVNVRGFNVYHKNRLILPSWKVCQENSSRGRGVVGVLEANFVKPAHDKQDFEMTDVLLRLKAYLKQVTLNIWNLKCHLINYQPSTKAGKAARKQTATSLIEYPGPFASLTPGDGVLNPMGGPSTAQAAEAGGSRSTSANSEGHTVKTEPVEVPHNSWKRSSSKNRAAFKAVERYKRQRTASNAGFQANAAPAREAGDTSESALVEQPSENHPTITYLIRENTQLKSMCVKYEHDIKKLESKVLHLEKELELRDVRMKNVNLLE